MVPIAGKYVARRSLKAVPMIEFVGGTTLAAGSTPADQIRALRDVFGRLSMGARSRLADAVEAYLDVVESAVV